MRTLRLRTGWVTLTGTGAAASIAFGMLVFASVLASLAIPRDSTGLRTGALRHVVTASPLDQAVLGAVGLTTASNVFGMSQGESPAPEIAAIKAYVEGGGCLLIDQCGGTGQFDEGTIRPTTGSAGKPRVTEAAAPAESLRNRRRESALKPASTLFLSRHQPQFHRMP